MKKVLLIADSPYWIFSRHCKEIKNRITDFCFDIAYSFNGDPGTLGYNNYDIIYTLDIGMRMSFPPAERTVLGLRNQFMYTKDRILDFFNKKIRGACKVFHVVNNDQFSDFESLCSSNKIPLFLAPHGVDIDVFKPINVPRKNKEFTVGFSGNTGSRGLKGVDIMQRACLKNGIHFIQSGKKLTKEQMPLFYNELDVYLCMSDSEGLNNSSLEAGAMGIPVISTRSGAAPEIIVDGENGFLVDRSEESLEQKLILLKNNPNERIRLGKNLMQTIVDSWSWDIKIKEYRNMFSII